MRLFKVLGGKGVKPSQNFEIGANKEQIQGQLICLMGSSGKTQGANRKYGFQNLKPGQQSDRVLGQILCCG